MVAWLRWALKFALLSPTVADINRASPIMRNILYHNSHSLGP